VQLQKLKSEMQRAHELIELCKKRDRLKRESLFLDMLIFEQKQKVRGTGRCPHLGAAQAGG